MSERGRVGLVARALGFAGLLPQAALVILLLADLPHVVVLAAVYPLVILSFLGGIWWGFAMRLHVHQAALASLAVMPSLIAIALALALGITRVSGWVYVVIGSVIVSTLLVDRWLANNEVAPLGWMTLRIPLSVGLGGLTIIAGAIWGQSVGG